MHASRAVRNNQLTGRPLSTQNAMVKRIGFWRETWSLAPAAVFMLAGMAVSVDHFIRIEDRVFQAPALVGGVLLFGAGALLELKVRFALMKKAGFPSMAATKRLLIPDEPALITDGVFGIIRHPLYLGRIALDFGIALACTSGWGAALMALSALGFLVRIQVEEAMLVEEFGDAYRAYQRNTKMLIPGVL